MRRFSHFDSSPVFLPVGQEETYILLLHLWVAPPACQGEKFAKAEQFFWGAAGCVKSLVPMK